MPKDDVKRLGRIEYIEPNNMFVHSEGNTVQNGIPQPYEDYSFSVNLRVINGDRFGCGMTNSGDDILENVLEYSSENGTLSFMDGTVAGGQSYFTTNFTDISMNNPDTNTRECLGIDNISIRYDSWYYPTVEIRFIDVRGASLMQPAEYEYYNNGGNMADKDYHKSNSKFFKSFFTFPYPLFKLSVKGFYGKELTYDLSVLKTNIIFNSETGNFEIIANFIGYMYGMYADLPFPFIYLAPYIDLYGKNTWDEKRGNGDFCYIDTEKENKGNVMMHTFPELKMVIENAGKKAEREYGNSDSGLTMAELDILVKHIDQNLLFKFPVTKGNYEWWKWSKTDTEENSSGYFFISLENTAENNRKVFEDFYSFLNSLYEYNDLVASSKTEFCKQKKLVCKDEYDAIFKKAKEIKKNHKDNSAKYDTVEKTVSSDFTDNEISEILGIKIANIAFHREDNEKDETSVLIFDEKSSSFPKNGKSEFSELIDELLTRFKNKEVRSPMQRGVYETSWNIKAIKVTDIHYYNELVSFANDLRKKLDELKKGLDNLRTQNIRDAIGFKPTIKNLYNLLFAHTDTFMSCFYNTLDKIREKIQGKDVSRKYENICGGQGNAKIEVDVSDNALKSDSPNGGKLPPFTMFYKEEAIKDSKETKLVTIWPGDLEGGKDLDEVKLVEAIVNATSLTRRRFTPVSEKDNVIPLRGDVVPTNYYDIIKNNGNPYLDILNDKTVNKQETAEEIIKVFMLRCFYSLLNGSYVTPQNIKEKDNSASNITNFTEKAKLIAKLEVNNVRRAFQMLKMGPSQAIINQLLGMSSDGSVFLSKFLKENNQIFSSNGSGTELFYRWIKRNGSDFYLYPVGIFSSSTLDIFSKGGQDAKGDINKFLLMNQNGTLINSFSAHLYNGGKQLESVLDKYGTSDFANASRLFPNYKSLPKTLSEITFYKEPILENTINILDTVKTEAAQKDNTEITIGKLYSQIDGSVNQNNLPRIPSARKTSAGYTSVFMDPLYYAQEGKMREDGKISRAIEARAYLFLMGIPYGFDKKFLLPEKAENGDYPTLMLLREGAIYWRNDFIKQYYFTGSTQGTIEGDPITYTYTINGVTNNILAEIEANDPCFGIKYPVEFELNKAKGVTEARKQLLIDYFLAWANGVKKERASDVTAESYIKREFKKPILDFQTIESMLGLYENVSIGPGEVLLSQLLSPASCSSAVTAPTTTSFANGAILKVIYNVEKDNKLGKVNGKIRTGVLLRNSSEIGDVSENIKQFLENFVKFYCGFDTILDYATFDSENKNLSVPKNAMNDALSEFIHGFKEYCGVTPEQIKNSKGIDSTGKQEDKETKREFFKNDNLKLACYMALKNLYDRWLCNRRREHWYFSVIPERLTNNGIKSDFIRFFYIDEFYHDNGMKIQPNLSNFINNVSNLGGFTEESNPENLTSSSLISILCDTAEYAGAALLTLPTMLGLARNYGDDSRSKIDEVFKAYPYNERVHTDEIETSFVVLYSNQKSSFLDNPDDKGNNGYRQDGFDIANTWGEIVPQSMFSDVSDSSYVVPCFGVTFAKQNQSFFKNLRLSMDNHQVTDFSIRNEVMISYQSNMGPRETPMVGQDMYNVFSNYSYSCTVSMMGDAQITPLMYFQLNNIPMWKGAYMITTVHHNISIKGMDTEFTGVRQARPTVPYVDEQINTAADNDITEAPYEDKKEVVQPAQTDDLNISKRPLDTIDVEKVEYIVFVLDRMSLRNRTDGYNFIDGVLSAKVYLKDSTDKKPINYNNIANTLEPYTALKGKIENFTPDENESYFAIPAGRYIENIRVENIPVNAEYRSANDSFYSFTDGRHILITDEKLKNKDGVRLYCEMVTGGTSMDGIDGGGISSFSFGGTCPIMLQGDTVNENGEVDVNKQFDKDEIRATYKEVFNLIKRMNNAGKRISLFINETDGLPTKIIK